jgi:uroporphyrinogen III methyltransferase / synthase
MAGGTGKVYLVGSGPGNLAYLTVRGYQLLAQADVLVYDALVPETCSKLDVGKRGGKPSTPQAEINRLLVLYCQRDRQVVRLKSGDPFIFGRCVAEIEALLAANCEFEVVPGISSALAAPLLAHIPLTDPVLSRCFAVLSAHDPAALNWQSLATLETLVILMGAKHLDVIANQLQRYGRSPQTPVAVIRWAGQPQQQIWSGTLATIGQLTSRQPLSPCVIVVGEVVGLRQYLQPVGASDYKTQPSLDRSSPALPAPQIPSRQSSPASMTPALPLTAQTILVTRAAGQSSQFTALLEQQGATVIEMPTLEITPPSSWQALDRAIETIEQFDWLILTSTNAVEFFLSRLQQQGKDVRALAGIRLAVVGKKTAASLIQRGLQPDFIPPDFVADSLVEHFPERDRLAQLKLLFPRVESGGRDVLVRNFADQGASVVEVPAYASGCAQQMSAAPIAALQQQSIDIVTFASSKTVRCFHHLLQQETERTGTSLSLATTRIASIGPQTSDTCRELFGRVEIEAASYTLEGLVEAIVESVQAGLTS